MGRTVLRREKMKYGESTFDIVYLLFAIIIGVRILRKRRDAVGRLMLPKTVCYMLLVWAFWKEAGRTA